MRTLELILSDPHDMQATCVSDPVECKGQHEMLPSRQARPPADKRCWPGLWAASIRS
jgi:hypothetical protein